MCPNYVSITLMLLMIDTAANTANKKSRSRNKLPT